MSNNYYVYKHTNKVNNKVYIGITSMEPNKRWANGNGYSGQRFGYAILKYGWDGFKHEVLYSGLSELQAKILEVSLIYFYNSTNPKYGYNVSEGGYVVSEETRKKISKGNKGKVRSEETKAKISEANKGSNNPNYGKHLSDEQKAKISEAQRGANNNMYGRTGFNNSTSTSCICLTTGFAFGSTYEAGKFYNTHGSSVSSCCRGKLKSAGKLNGEKLRWKYICDLPKPKLTELDKEHLRYIRDKYYNN